MVPPGKTCMNLADIKKSAIPKRRLFQVERAVVREATDLWCKEKSYFSDNFAENVDIEFKGTVINVTFTNTARMNHGLPEVTVNEMMRGLILTMATSGPNGALLKDHEAIIGNILDVFVHRLKEISDKKFILQRLQTLDLGFSIVFGLDSRYYSIRRARPYLEEMLTVASLSSPEETVDTLLNNIISTESLAKKEQGVTFHIFMVSDSEASFISVPFDIEQAGYVSLLGTHTLRCNIIARYGGKEIINNGILKIDAPSDPISFIRHKGFDLFVDEAELMEKLCRAAPVSAADFTDDELCFLKLLYNEYVQLGCFLLRSGRVDRGLRLLIIFPRANIFSILHAEKSGIPPDEPQTLGELASMEKLLFSLQKSRSAAAIRKDRRIPERVIQEKVDEVVYAFARNIIQNIYKPVTDIKRILTSYAVNGYGDADRLAAARRRVDEVSLYLKRLKRIRRCVISHDTKQFDIDASIGYAPAANTGEALEDIVSNIQASESEQIREVIVSKMLDFLSFVTVRLEQLGRVSSPYIKEEVVKEIESYSSTILAQAKSFYRLIADRQRRSRP